MRAVIKNNGMEIPEALCIVDTANNSVSLTTMTEPCMELDLQRVYVEVNIFGELVMLEENRED